MLQSRDEIRKVYVDVWNKLQAGQLLEPMEAVIADVIQLHPEYHGLLGSGEDAFGAEFSPEAGHSNPFLHMGMHIAIREQLSIDRPAGIKSIYQSLCARMEVHDAEHAMLECLAQSLWQAQRDNRPPDEQAYLDCLKKI